MAQIIQCDAHNLEHRADWLVTRLEDGEVMAYCNAGYLELMTMTVEATNREEADETDRDAQARLEAVQAPAAADTFDPSEGSPDPIQAAQDAPQGDEPDPVRAFELDDGTGWQAVNDETGDASIAPTEAEARQKLDDPGPIGVTRIIHRGESARAIGFREREAEREAAEAATATAEPGDDDEDDDEAGSDDRDGGPPA